MRLREERLRLGLSQVALAKALDVTKWTVINYERTGDGGTPIPANSLSACARLGMDVQYILTGMRSSNLGRVADEAGSYRVELKVANSPDELKLLEKYRRLKSHQRSQAHAILDALAATEKASGKKTPAPARTKKR
ncbi:MAG: helix-turn-helix transcriptional regulator [Gammaproteobacteria bacterium]|nr:helix-turn-helix transcriptional regulator [Gammaproteobacteria bacterium]